MMKRLALSLLFFFTSVPLFAQATNPNLEGGFSPEKAYHVDDLDAINLFNLNLNASIPLGQTYRAGGKLPYAFVLHYSGNAWESASRDYSGPPPEFIPFVAAWRFPARTTNAGFGWRLSFGRMLDAYTATCSLPIHLHPPGTTNYSGPPWVGYESEDGAIHCFYDTPHDVINESQSSDTDYNASTGVFLPSSGGNTPSGFNGAAIAAASPWLLGLATYSTVTAAEQQPNASAVTTTSKSYTCFDSTNGFLLARRAVRALGAGQADPPLGTHDLLTVYTRDSHGNVASERYYGGDDFSDPPADHSVSAAQACVGIGAEAYHIEHAYDTAGNLLSSQYYDGSNAPLSFKIADHALVDAATGLVMQTRAGATSSDSGQVADYKYDDLGRLTSSHPASGAWSDYAYAFSPPSVVVTARPNNSSTGILKQNTYQYDGFGRLTQENRTLAGNVASNRRTSYNHLGWKTRQSEWETSPTHFSVFSYDAFGRPLQVQSPDGSKVTMAYSGVSSMSRTVSVGTDATVSTTTFSDATTTETYDRQGRLWQLTEPNGVVTQYTYDVGGGLAHVCMNVSGAACGQQRVFTRDGAGLLIGEQHPEKGSSGNGTTTYKYDARGHATNRVDGSALGPFDLTYAYDRAERLLSISETRQMAGVKRNLKSFSYAISNDTAAPDWANGKLRSATRFNWIDSLHLNVQVVETYRYGGTAGRADKRTTAEYECDTNAGSCNALPAGTPARQFETSLTYDDLGGAATITNPACTTGCPGVPAPSVVTDTYEQGMLKSVRVGGFPDNVISYSDNGMVYQVQHSNGVVDTQTPDPTRMPRPAGIDFANALDASACTPPTIKTNPPSVTVTTPNSVTLTPVVSADFNTTDHPLTYHWYIGQPGDTSQTAPNGSSLSLTIAPTATTSYWMRVQSDCGSADTVAAVVTVCTPPTVTTNPSSTTITRGQTKTLEVVATGTPPSYQWYEGQRGDASHPIAGATNAWVTVSPQTTTSYWVSLQNACGGYQSLAATLTVVSPPTAPQNVVASWNGARITVTWTGSSSQVGIQYYQVQRASDGAGYRNYTTVSSQYSTLLDTVTAGKAYAYKVMAVDTNGVASSPSTPDAAVAMTFDDDPLVPQVTHVRGIHFSQLRQAVDALRAAAGAGPNWLNYSPLTGKISASAVTEIRQYLDLARTWLGLPPLTYRMTPLSGHIMATDVKELRDGVK